MQAIELKQKLRRLKKLEQKIRGTYLARHHSATLVWNSFFSTKNDSNAEPEVKYPLNVLRTFDREQRKQAFEEFLYTVFARHHTEEGISIDTLHDPELLSFLGLPPYATLTEIKTRFRVLAHKYHPDKGGDTEAMIRLLEVYQKIFPKK
ncbi:MAG: DnaJ domain-containing protein [bacterium]|nr:DnaJ domain-containing protein [bacterium]